MAGVETCRNPVAAALRGVGVVGPVGVCQTPVFVGGGVFDFGVVAGLIVLVDTYEAHKTKRAAVAAAHAAAPSVARPAATVTAPPSAG